MIARLASTVFLAASAAALFGLSPAPADPTPEAASAAGDAFTIDIVHSTITYRVRHFGVSYFWGRINLPSGTFKIDDDDLASSHVKVVIEIKNMDAGNDTRNCFLTGPDFFNVREYPTAEFASTSIRKHDDGSYEATGPLTMHGVTREVAVRINEYTEKQTERFGFRGGFECVFDVNRSDFGMDLFVNEKTETLGDPVRIIAAIEGVVQPEG